MLKLTQQQEKIVLISFLAVLALLIVYRVVTAEKPKTAPLAFPPGSVARSTVRQNPLDPASGADLLNIFIAKRKERYPGVSRDIFRMENPAPKPKPAPVIAAPLALPPAPPQPTPEELAAELSRAELSKFRFLGYLTDRDNNTLFLSREGELLIVKSGDIFGKNFQVKKATKDYVILIDTATHVEMRFDLAGGEPQSQLPAPQQAQKPVAVTTQQMPQPMLQPAHPPAQHATQKPAQQPSVGTSQPQNNPTQPMMPDPTLRRRLRTAIPPGEKQQ